MLRGVDKDQPAVSIGVMDDVLDAATAEPGFYTRVLGTFALLALVLALVGTYGVIAYSVARRGQEIGVRMALGARAPAVLWLVMRRTLLLGAAGVVAGTAGAWMATRLLNTFLFETRPTDPATFTAVAIVVFSASLLAGVIPARRATRVDPIVALRHEGVPPVTWSALRNCPRRAGPPPWAIVRPSCSECGPCRCAGQTCTRPPHWTAATPRTRRSRTRA